MEGPYRTGGRARAHPTFWVIAPSAITTGAAAPHSSADVPSAPSVPTFPPAPLLQPFICQKDAQKRREEESYEGSGKARYIN